MTDRTAEEERAAVVAKGLTKAQREDVIASGPCFFWTADGRTARGMERKGLVLPDGRKWTFTPLGLAVRDHLRTHLRGLATPTDPC